MGNDWLDRYAAALAAEAGADDAPATEDATFAEARTPGTPVESWSNVPVGDQRAVAVTDDLPADIRRIVLDLARVVAHGTERRNAPLATFLAGSFVAERVAAGAEPTAAAAESLRVAEDMLADEGPSAP